MQSPLSTMPGRTLATFSVLLLPALARYGIAEDWRPPVAVAVPVASAPRLDGTLDDPVWAAATPVNLFRQREPVQGKPGSGRTEVRIVYDEAAVYFGIQCESPVAVTARELRRDAPQDADDYFQILIDPRHDRRSAFVFQLNPNGTQRDGLILEERGADDGSDFDTGWDGVWISETKIWRRGWTATVAVPFSTLNITHAGELVWGLNFKRFVRGNSEEDLWSAYEHDFGITKVSRAGELHGIVLDRSDRLFVVKPYGLAGARAGSGNEPLNTGGVDAKVGLGANTVLNVTVNTDFADSDIDLVQFNLTPYALYLPEKRQFFLEDQGAFDFFTGLQERLFYTRQIGIDTGTGRIVPIDVGAKLVSRLHGFEIGLLEVKTRASNFYAATNLAVARIKYALPGGSYVGMIGIDKTASDGSYNQAFGVDARLVLRSNLVLSTWAAETRTPGIHSRQTDEGGNIRYSTSWFSGLVQHIRIGENYNPEVGFIGELGVKKTYVDTTFRKQLRNRLLRDVHSEQWVYYVPASAGYLLTREWNISAGAAFNNGSLMGATVADSTEQRLIAPFAIYKSVAIPAGVYRFNRPQVSFSSPPGNRLAFSVSDRFGSFYNGRLNELSALASYRPGAKLALAAGATLNQFSLPEARFSVLLSSLQSTYSFSRRLSLGALLQVNTADTKALSGSVRLRYNYRPNSDLFVIFTAGPTYLSSLGPGLGARETKFVVKLTRSFTVR